MSTPPGTQALWGGGREKGKRKILRTIYKMNLSLVLSPGSSRGCKKKFLHPKKKKRKIGGVQKIFLHPPRVFPNFGNFPENSDIRKQIFSLEKTWVFSPKTCRNWHFRNPSALWWGQFAEMAKLLVLVKMSVR